MILELAQEGDGRVILLSLGIELRSSGPSDYMSNPMPTDGDLIPVPQTVGPTCVNHSLSTGLRGARPSSTG